MLNDFSTLGDEIAGLGTMRVIPINPHLTLLRRFWIFNSYVVHEIDGLTLVDTNLPGTAKGILRAVAETGAPIRRILLTHAHGDHAGSLDALHDAVPNAEVLIGRREAPLLQKDLSLEPGEPDNPIRGSFRRNTTQPTRLLDRNDKIGSLRVIESPGHTPGHLAFLDERDGTLIAGDAFSSFPGVTVAGRLRFLFPLVALATWHKPTALQSARDLRDLKPELLCVGHGAPVPSPVGQMDQAIDDAEQRLALHPEPIRAF